MRLLSELEGRVEDIVYRSDGVFVHPRLIWKVFKHRPGVLRYQLVQHDIDRFELRLATTDRAAFDAAVPAVLADLRALLGDSAAIQAIYQDSFEPQGGRKFRPVLNLTKPNSVSS